MNFKKIIASVLTVVCLLTCLGVTASAETVSTYSLVNGVSPLYEIADSLYSHLNIIGTDAECISKAYGHTAVEITVEQTLQKYSGWFWIWNGVDGASWTKTVNQETVFFVNTKGGLTSGTYRVKSVFKLTDKNGKKETLTIYSDEVKI